MQFNVQRRPVATETSTFATLLARNLDVDGDVDAVVRWQYLEGPMPPGCVFLLKGHEHTVGCAGISTRFVHAAGHELRVAHFANFAVDRAHRTALPAITLQRAVKAYADECYDIALGFANAHSLPVYRRVGYHVLGNTLRYARVLRHKSYLERYVRPQVAATLGGALLDRVLLRRTPDRVVWLADVDARFDELWRHAHGAYGAIARRDSAFVRWRCIQKPNQRHAVATIFEGERIAAYAVVRGEPGGIAEVADFFGSVEALDRLLGALVPALYRLEYTAVYLRFLGDPRVCALLASHGFKPREVERKTVIHVTPRSDLDARGRAALLDPTSWFLTELDADT